MDLFILLLSGLGPPVSAWMAGRQYAHHIPVALQYLVQSSRRSVKKLDSLNEMST